MSTRTTLVHRIIQERALKHLKLVSWLAAPLWLVWIGFDYLFAPEQFYLFLPIRIGGTLISLLTVYYLDKCAIQTLHRLMYSFYIGVLTLMMLAIPTSALTIYFMGYAMILMIMFFVLILSISEIVYFASITALSFLHILFLSGHETVLILGNGGFVFVTIYIVMVFISGIRYTGLLREIELIRSAEKADFMRTSNEKLQKEIEERKQIAQRLQYLLEEKEILLKEVHHRVKNNLQVISSILSLQSATTADSNAIALLSESRRRIRAMALIHEKLYKTQNFSGIDFGHYLKQLTHDLVDSYHAAGEDPPNLLVTADSTEINLDQAIPFGLMVNELISNALKYGRPKTGTQVIRVELVRKKDTIALIVCDNGSGFAPNESVDDSSTLGLQLVKTLTEQLEGTCKFENDVNGGAKVTIEFPYLN